MIEKDKVVDIIVKLDDRNRIIVEMNYSYHKHAHDKSALYGFATIIEATTPNMEHYPKSIIVNIDAYNRFHTDKSIDIFRIQDEDGNTETDTYESIHFIRLN